MPRPTTPFHRHPPHPLQKTETAAPTCLEDGRVGELVAARARQRHKVRPHLETRLPIVAPPAGKPRKLVVGVSLVHKGAANGTRPYAFRELVGGCTGERNDVRSGSREKGGDCVWDSPPSRSRQHHKRRRSPIVCNPPPSLLPLSLTLHHACSLPGVLLISAFRFRLRSQRARRRGPHRIRRTTCSSTGRLFASSMPTTSSTPNAWRRSTAASKCSLRAASGSRERGNIVYTVACAVRC